MCKEIFETCNFAWCISQFQISQPKPARTKCATFYNFHILIISPSRNQITVHLCSAFLQAQFSCGFHSHELIGTNGTLSVQCKKTLVSIITQRRGGRILKLLYNHKTCMNQFVVLFGPSAKKISTLSPMEFRENQYLVRIRVAF